jgi:hypothetical protein
MGALEYVVGVTAGFVEALGTLPWLAAANFLSMNVMEYHGKFYQVLPFPVRELSWVESHIVLPLVDTRVVGVLPATTVIWLVSILLSGVLGYYVAKCVIRKVGMN